MLISSPAFEQNAQIPARYTCEGENLSPPLEFHQLPIGTLSLVLIAEDPDAPNGVFDHWVGWNISPTSSGTDEASRLPREGKNGYGSIGYRGPCPPPGPAHRYFFRLYALDILLETPAGASKETILKAMQGHIIAKAELVGTYQRSHR